MVDVKENEMALRKSNVLEITFVDAGKTVRMKRVDANKLFGAAGVREAIKGHIANLVMVELYTSELGTGPGVPPMINAEGKEI